MVKPVSRREFLYLLWGGSAGVLAMGACGITARILSPQMRIGFDKEWVPVDTQTLLLRYPSLVAMRLWVSNGPSGLFAFYTWCPNKRDLTQYAWNNANNRFECPACGSKFKPNGEWIEGPAPRGLDRHRMRLTLRGQSTIEVFEYAQVNPANVESLIVDTTRVVMGTRRPETA